MNDKEIIFFLKGFEKTDFCWVWKRALDTYGYGVCQKNGKQINSHRFSYEYFCGKIPAGMLVMHRCDNPPCVNPEHLKIGTYKDNALDMVVKKRNNPNPKYGKENHNYKLSDKDICYIKNYPKEYGIRKKLGKIFNVSPLTIKSIRSGGKERYRKL